MLQRRPRFEETTDLCILAKSIFWRNRFELDLPLRYEQRRPYLSITQLPNYPITQLLNSSVSPCLRGELGFSRGQFPPRLRASVVLVQMLMPVTPPLLLFNYPITRLPNY